MLTFKSPPDFEDPEDASKDNIYLAEVTARNLSLGTVMKVEVRVSVTNVIGEPPTVVTEISSPLLVEGFDAYDIDLSGTFKDDDGDGLMFGVSSSSTGVVTAEIAPGGTTLTLTEVGPGSSEITVTANDGNGGMASAMFTVTVSRLFITTWNTGPDKSIIIPTHVGVYNYTVNWGDMSAEQTFTGDATHTYATAGTYTVTITGAFPWIYFNDKDDLNTNADKIQSIVQWGNIAWGSMHRAFAGCSKLRSTATDAPDLSGVVDMSEMFFNAVLFDRADLSNWNVSNVTNMESMFQGAFAFDGNISNWNVRRVTSMGSMFEGAIVFNGNISNWDVRGVRDMSSMFKSTSEFNQDIGGWNVSSVLSMPNMFAGARAFNQNISGWDVSNVVNMQNMFQRTRTFNQNIGGWDVGSVTNMSEMFEGAEAFNQDIGGWDVSGVRSMTRMFEDAEVFNQNIGGWNVSIVTNMTQMFKDATAFNGDISGWDVSMVTTMTRMFEDAIAFDRDLGDWDVSDVLSFSSFLKGTGLSCENYDALLIGWNKLTLMPGLTFHAGNSRYTAAAATARQAMTSITGDKWSITDGNGPIEVISFDENSENMVRDINVGTGSVYTLGTSTTGNKRDDDNAEFNIDENTGVLTFKNAPDFENPGDANENNKYAVEVTVTNDDTTPTKVDFKVSVTNVNEPPVVDSEIPDRSLNTGFANESIDFMGTFMDPDAEDELTYTVVSSVPGVVTASIADGNVPTLTLTEVANGSSVITVTARDENGLEATDMFTVMVSVNSVPTVVALSAIPNQLLNTGFETKSIDLSDTFTDPDTDELMYTVESSIPGVVTAAIADGAPTLTLTEVGPGSSEITVTANDGRGGTVPHMFNVKVNSPPVLAVSIPTKLLDTEFVTHVIDLSGTFTDPDTDDLTYTVVSSSMSVVTAEITDGTMLTLTHAGPGSSDITVTARDGRGGMVPHTFTVKVNNAPVATSIDTQLLDTDFDPHVIDLSDTFTDPDTDELMYTVGSSVPGVVSAAIADGAPMLTLTHAGPGSSEITVTARDGRGGTVIAMFTVKVNKAPVATAIATQLLDTDFDPHVIDLSDTFTDPDTDELMYTVGSSVPGVVSAAIADGSTMLTLTHAGPGSSDITVTAKDGRGGTVIAMFTVKVNEPPVATSIATQLLNTAFGTHVIDLSVPFTDPDTDELMYTVGSSVPGVVSAEITGGTMLTLTHVGPGSSEITVTAKDGRGGTVIATFMVKVNNAPVATSISGPPLTEGLEAGAIDLAATFMDPDMDELTYTVSSSTGVVTAAITGGTMLTLTGVMPGSSEITVTATDGRGGTVTHTFTVTVMANMAPTVVVANAIPDQSLNTGFANESINFAGTFMDSDAGDALTYTAVSSTGVVTVAIADETVSTLILTEVMPGSSEITVTATDKGGSTATDMFRVMVNRPPVATSIATQLLNTAFGTHVIDLSVPFTDPDTDELMYTVGSSVPGVVSAAITGGTMLTLTHVGPGSSEITVTAKDGRGGTVIATFMVKVNNAPVATSISGPPLTEGLEAGAIDLAATFMDPDMDELTYTVSSSTGVVTAAITGGTMLTLTGVMPGSSEITVTATDGRGGTVTHTFTVTVMANMAPTVVVANAIPDQSLNTGFANESINFAGTFMDSDAGDALTYTAVSSTGVVTVAIADETVSTLILTEVMPGSSEITVTATDKGGSTATDMFRVMVNRPPVATSIATQLLNTAFGTHVIDLSVPFTDPDTDELMYTVGSSVPGVVSAEITGGTMLTLTHVGPGSSEITVTAKDGRGGTVIATFMVKVNNAPVATAISGPPLTEGLEAGAIDLAATFMDPDMDELTYTVSSSTGVVTAAITGGTMLTLTGVMPGSSEITVTATDGRGGTVTHTFTVTVMANMAPVVVVANAIPDQSLNTGFANESINFAGTFMDSDAGDALTYTAVSSTGVVTVAIADETVSTLILTEVMPGSSEITVTATDKGGSTATDMFRVMVNRPPVATSIATQLLNTAFGTHVIDLSVPFTDPDTDELMYTVGSSVPGVVSAEITGGTMLTLTHVGPGSSEITVTAKDGRGGTVIAMFTVKVNNAPVATAISGPPLTEGLEAGAIDLAATFMDPDMDELTYTVSSSTGVVTAAITGGTMLTLTGVMPGSSEITVTATDGRGGTVTHTFTVTVMANMAPTVVVANAIPDQSLNTGFANESINFAGTFMDSDAGDALTYTAVSSTGVVTVAIADETVSTLILTEVMPGSSEITVTATDKGGSTATDMFRVMVNRPPVATSIATQLLNTAFGTHVIDLSVPFTDPDTDELMYTVGSSVPGVVSAEITGGTMLTLTHVGPGSSEITVTAKDGRGGTVIATFMVKVNNAPVATAISGPPLTEGLEAGAIDLAATFMDPDMDELTYTVSSSTGVVTAEITGGTMLTLTGVMPGSSEITVTATDGRGGTVHSHVHRHRDGKHGTYSCSCQCNS